MDLTGVNFTSHTQLGTYEKCSELHYREYVLKKRKRVESDSFIIGDLCHKSLEAYYRGVVEIPLDALYELWGRKLDDMKLGVFEEPLRAYTSDMRHLYARARADYNGPDPIRTKDGKVPSNPAMTTEWKKTVEKLRLGERKEDIDHGIQRVLNDPAYTAVSFSTCYAETVDIIDGYLDPPQLSAIEYVEFPMSQKKFQTNPDGSIIYSKDRKPIVESIINPVVFPGIVGWLLNGFIDLVANLRPDLGGGVVLLDHKTSKGEAPSPVAVANHEQLLKYAWGWNELFGSWPTHIGINHLRSHTCVIVPVDPKKAIQAIQRNEQLIKMQEMGVHVKHDPFAYGSPCLMLKSDGTPSNHCAHLEDCHPEVAKDLGLIQLDILSI